MTDPAPPTAARSSARTRTAAVILAGFCAFLTMYAPQPLLPMLARAFGATAGTIGLVVTITTTAVAITAPFAGAVADRLGRRNVIVPAAFLLAFPTLMAGTAGSLNQLLFWRFWQGIFTPGIFAVTIAYITEEWEYGRGAAMSAYITGTIVGGFSGRMISAFAAAQFSWRWSFFVLGVLNAVGGLAIWKWLPPGRRQARARRGASTARAMMHHLRNGRLVATYAVGFCVLFCQLLVFNYINFYLAAPPFHLGTRALGLLFAVYLIGAFFTPFAGRMIDRKGHRLTLSAGFVVGIAGISLTLVQNLPAVILGLGLLCTGLFAGNAVGASYVGSVAREGRAAAVGLYVLFYYGGGSVGSSLGGRVFTQGGWPACVALVIGVFLSTIALAWRCWKPLPAGQTAVPSSRATLPAVDAPEAAVPSGTSCDRQ